METETSESKCLLFEISSNNNKEEEEELSYEEKLKIFEKDLETLCSLASSKGFSTDQIQACLSPMLGDGRLVGKHILKGWSTCFAVISVLIAVVAVLWSVPATKNMIVVHSKLLSMKVTPYWNWERFLSSCLIANPFLENKEMSKEDCARCFDFEKVQMINGSDQERVSELLRNDVPFLVTNATKGWPRDNRSQLVFTIDRINQLFKKYKILADVTKLANCTMSSSENNYTLADFAEALAADSLPGRFYMSWVNCETNAAKVYRMLGKRPYFLPPFAETDPVNQIIIARGNMSDSEINISRRLSPGSAALLIAIAGRFQVHIKPHRECVRYDCTSHSFVVAQGEGFAVQTRIWNVTLSPLGDEYSLGYSTKVYWNN